MLIVIDSELDIVWQMQPLDRDVFMYLAQRVDLLTGVVGKSRAVSYGGMALDLTERVTAGRSVGALRVVTSKQVLNSVGRLVAAGLFRRLSVSGQCNLLLERVFLAEKLNAHKSVKNKVGRELGGRLVDINGIFNNVFNELNDFNEVSWEDKIEEVGTTLSINQSNYSGSSMSKNERFAMPLDWQYSEKDLEVMVKRAGLKFELINPVWVAEFIAYWYADGRELNQREWFKKLSDTVIDNLRNPGLFDKRRGLVADASKPARAVPVVQGGGNEWERVPRDDSKLMGFIQRWGFTMPPPGASFEQARARLAREIEQRKARGLQ